MTAPAGENEATGDEFARDSLHLLPLSMLPVRTPGLRKAILRKNHRLQTVIEVFNTPSSGSGQVDPSALIHLFPGYPNEVAFDQAMFRRLQQVPSFDVYSLRIELRRLEIPVEDHEALKLSPRKRDELTGVMKSFTRPLIAHIYGIEQNEVTDVSDIIASIRRPIRQEALENLQMMADRLRVTLPEIPQFLEDYGDVFLSLAYFREILDGVVPDVHSFLEWMEDVRKTREVRYDRPLQLLFDAMTRDLSEITGSITGRFESFDRRTRDFWTDITAERFHEVRDMIIAHHTTIGGVLCGLVLKMDLWRGRYAGKSGIGPLRRIEFIKGEILPGLDYMRDLERSAANIR
jgi:hypothetical protein